MRRESQLLIFWSFYCGSYRFIEWYWRPQHFYTKRCVLMRSITFARKNEILIEKSSLITILPLFFMKKIRFFWVKFACFYHEKISRQLPPKILFIPKDSPWKTASFGRWTTEKKTCRVNRIFHYKETYYNTFSIISKGEKADFFDFFNFKVIQII